MCRNGTVSGGGGGDNDKKCILVGGILKPEKVNKIKNPKIQKEIIKNSKSFL